MCCATEITFQTQHIETNRFDFWLVFFLNLIIEGTLSCVIESITAAQVVCFMGWDKWNYFIQAYICETIADPNEANMIEALRD